jgi:hypothetical protein
MNSWTGSVFQRLTLSEAEFRSKFGVDGHPRQGDALTGAALHDPPMIAAASSTPWFIKAIGIGTGLVSITSQIISTSCAVLAMSAAYTGLAL